MSLSDTNGSSIIKEPLLLLQKSFQKLLTKLQVVEKTPAFSKKRVSIEVDLFPKLLLHI